MSTYDSPPSACYIRSQSPTQSPTQLLLHPLPSSSYGYSNSTRLAIEKTSLLNHSSELNSIRLNSSTTSAGSRKRTFFGYFKILLIATLLNYLLLILISCLQTFMNGTGIEIDGRGTHRTIISLHSASLRKMGLTLFALIVTAVFQAGLVDLYLKHKRSNSRDVEEGNAGVIFDVGEKL